MNLATWVERHGLRRPEEPALAVGERVHATWAEFASTTASVAAGLCAAHGLAPGDRVAILMDNRPDYPEAMFAAWHAGLVAVPVNARLHLGLLAVSVGYLSLYPSLEEQLTAMAADLPDAYTALLGDVDLASPEGYIRSQVYSLIAPLVVAGVAIAAATGLARAERDRTLVAALMSPLGRRAVATGWALFVVAVTGIVSMAIVVGVAVGAPLAGAEASFGAVMAATVPVLAFGSVAGGVALLAGVATGSPGVATGVGWLLVALSFVANSVAELIDSLSWLSRISPWSWHASGAAITGGGSPGDLAMLVGLGVVLFGMAVVQFERRDLQL